MSLTVGTEIQSYRTSMAPTGVPRVIRETHRYLTPLLAAAGIDLVPVKTSERSETAGRGSDPYVASDPVLAQPTRWPEDVDLLMLLNPSTAIDFARLVRLRRSASLPVIAMINDLLPVRRPEWFPATADLNYRVLFQQILHVADHVVVPSAHVRDDLAALGWAVRPTIHVIPLGSSFEQQPPRAADGDLIDLLYVSTIAPRKGHLRLIHAYECLKASGVPVRLTLVGKVGWEVEELMAELRSHPDLGTTLRWYAQADDDAVAALLAECTVAVVPAEGEGFGLFVEEALTAGVMVVATDLPVFRERANPNLIFAEASVAGLADAIRQAAARRPQPLAPGAVRSMQDFARDLADLVLDAVPQGA